MWLAARTRTPVATAPQMCATEKPEAPAPGGANEGSAFSLRLRPHQTQPEEYVARVLMMVCSVSAAKAASLATQGGEVHVGTWERAIAEHAYAGVTAKGVLAELAPAYTHRRDALVAVKADGTALKHASPELQADRELVLAAVRQDGWALKHASKELRADRELVLAAVQQDYDGGALEYASKELQADREVVLAAVQQDGGALEYASKELQADREVVLAAVQQDLIAVHFASPEVQADRELVLAVVRQAGLLLEYASKELQADREVVLQAVRQNGWALKHASPELRADREVVQAAVQELWADGGSRGAGGCAAGWQSAQRLIRNHASPELHCLFLG